MAGRIMSSDWIGCRMCLKLRLPNAQTADGERCSSITTRAISPTTSSTSRGSIASSASAYHRKLPASFNPLMCLFSRNIKLGMDEQQTKRLRRVAELPRELHENPAESTRDRIHPDQYSRTTTLILSSQAPTPKHLTQHHLTEKPNISPSAAMRVARHALSELNRSDARVAIQAVRIRELQQADERKKKTDRRRPKGTSGVYDQAELQRMRRERDERDAKRSRGRGQGRGRGQERSARVGGRGASRRPALRNITNQQIDH
ncbi:hypothetical protein GGX14DRAFT_404051 [Mycena pura]|uniref:Uncharacterized protein n=1 Tax=Mycena pura TaxID=153505 RepID=A0AAD6UUV8_9AGAR|nr:hypothetical protein GGX14DRAFT_404051 [Mycena pura]